jgi:bacterial/archaeal transporter family-2 protein
MSAAWAFPFIFIAGALQAVGAAMGGELNKSLGNPWLATSISFMLVLFVTLALFACMPRPLPSVGDLAAMPWWAPLGGIVGAVAVFAGFILIQKLGAGPVNGVTITANILASLAIDHFGLLRMEQHSLNPMRIAGAVLMIGGVTLISKF